MSKPSKNVKKKKIQSPKLGDKNQPYDKYALYKASVQAPDSDVVYLRDTYKELRGKLPKIMREDFCGTHAICCEWVKLDPAFQAVGIDLDAEPIEYGQKHYVAALPQDQQKRIQVLNKNVLDEGLPKADVIAALNFSYYIFKSRLLLRNYFKNSLRGLKPGGIFVVDCFGGSACQEANEEETYFEDEEFSYFWDQDYYDPVNNYAQFYIHFKRKGEKKREKVFSYDWRMWTIPEIREVMIEAGFKKAHVYWEGTTKKGDGDGKFVRVEKGEECESWIAYVVGEA
jgi:SAM-dependent methyltransferase